MYWFFLEEKGIFVSMLELSFNGCGSPSERKIMNCLFGIFAERIACSAASNALLIFVFPIVEN